MVRTAIERVEDAETRRLCTERAREVTDFINAMPTGSKPQQVARAKVADLSKRNSVLRRFFTTQVMLVDVLEQSTGYRSPDLQMQVETMGKHKLALTRMEVCF